MDTQGGQEDVMSAVISVTREELEDRRQQLLSRLPYGEAELQERAEDYVLTHEERSIWETLRSIDFLLGRD
jgi:hypothetical protein